MIKINDLYSAERDTYQWVLHKWYQGMDKQGNPAFEEDGTPVMKSHQTYYGNFEQCCRAALDRDGIDDGTKKDLKAVIKYFEQVVGVQTEKAMEEHAAKQPTKRRRRRRK